MLCEPTLLTCRLCNPCIYSTDVQNIGGSRHFPIPSHLLKKSCLNYINFQIKGVF